MRTLATARWGVPPRACAFALALTSLCLAPAASAAQDADPNILEARTRVAEMADESLDMLASRVALKGVDGWAVFSADRLQPELDLGPGVGMAESFDGETYFLRGRGRCLTEGHRHVLVFRDAALFREFRQGELQGPALERVRRDASAAGDSRSGDVLAFSFRPSDQPSLESMDLSGCRFALHRDLQRALIAEPSRTEGLVDEDDVDVDDD